MTDASSAKYVAPKATILERAQHLAAVARIERDVHLRERILPIIDGIVEEANRLKEGARACGHGPENWERDCPLCELVAT